MSARRPESTNPDVVVVGGRAAGAATAMLFARAGAEVLLVERGTIGRDTLSTHALMRGAIVQLDRWGLLDQLADSTPPITETTFHYPGSDVRLTMEPLYAPRRTLLDPLLIDAARAAGVTVLDRTSLAGLTRDRSGRVTGGCLRGRIDGEVCADLVVGADGLHSTVARMVDAPVTRAGRVSNATIYAYVEDAPMERGAYRWSYALDALAGVIPTNDRRHCVFVSIPTAEFRARRYGNVAQTFQRVLRHVDPSTAEAMAVGRQVGAIRSTPGHVGQFRQAVGPGWALVGDAGYFKDPGAAHGISDAFRDAELLARAALGGDLAAYERHRDTLSAELFDVLERIVGFGWDEAELQVLHGELIGAMANDLRGFLALVDPAPQAVAA